MNVEEETVAIPANIMGLLRQSYDSREKMLDWLLAIATVGVVVAVFWPQLRAISGRKDMLPNDNVSGALPNKGGYTDYLTYNLPPTRQLRARIGPSVTRIPFPPGSGPWYADQGENNRGYTNSPPAKEC